MWHTSSVTRIRKVVRQRLYLRLTKSNGQLKRLPGEMTIFNMADYYFPPFFIIKNKIIISMFKICVNNCLHFLSVIHENYTTPPLWSK